MKEEQVVKIRQHAREKEQEVLCVSGQRLSDTRRRRDRPEGDQVGGPCLFLIVVS